MTSDLHDDDRDPLSLPPALAGQGLTPRGGFMARPGLKTPPRHAVVVRVGDAPASPDIPVARSSAPPPPPTFSEDAPHVAPVTPSIPPPPAMPSRLELPPPAPVAAPPEHRQPAGLQSVSASEAAFRAHVESQPPPLSHAPLSDAPLVASDTVPPPPVRRTPPRIAILAAAAIGLLLGVVSVLSTFGATHPTVASQPVVTVVPVSARAPAVTPVQAPQLVELAAPPFVEASPLPSASSAPERATGAAAPPRPPGPAPKRTIF